MEKQTKTGVFISAITKEKMQERAMNLHGEDLKYFVEKCNPANLLPSSLIDHVIGISSDELISICKELEPNFNPETDYFVIRYAQPNEL